MNQQNEIIRTEDLSKIYNPEHIPVVALDKVNLLIEEGENTAIVGPSGCGKSSFLSAINRLSDLTPNCRVTGDIRIDGVDVLSSDTDLIGQRRRVGMIFEKPNPFPFLKIGT